MVKFGGYAGKILRVDLSENKTEVEYFDEEMAKSLIGGNGFGARILYDEVPSKIDPLSDENVLIFMTGPVQGTRIPAVGSRTCVITKSPLTGYFMDSYFGGDFGAKLKFAGYDGIIVKGKSTAPVYLDINDDDVKILPADKIWGKKTFEAQELLLGSDKNQDKSTVCIGPAGEKLVKMACIISGVHAAGRGGTGAVMGSKKLKAIVVRGTKGVRVPNISSLEDYSDKLVERFNNNPATGTVLPNFGTAAIVDANNKMGLLGTRNWQTEVFDKADQINAETLKNKAFKKSAACFSCPIACAKLNDMRDSKYNNAFSVGPEYETLWSLGSNCDNSDISSIIAGDRLCDEIGIDTVSAGSVIAMAMECFEKGIINTEDTGGLELSFGDSKMILHLLELIGSKKGFGAILGEGARKLGEKYNASKLAYETKGLEIPAHSPRGYIGMALGYATSNRGGTHQDGRPTAERAGLIDRKEFKGKGKYIANVQRMTTLADCLIACRFTEGIFGATEIKSDMADIIKLVTGMELTLSELVDVADRVYTLEKAFNIREGLSRKDDTLPYRTFNEPIPEGPSKGDYFPKEEFEKELNKYYEERGWSEEGIPKKETLEKLGLSDIAYDLKL